jgi:hypothetical protein
MDDQTTTTEAPSVEPSRSLSDLAIELESARAAHSDAKTDFERAKERVKHTAEGERAAYKAFNDAVAAMKPKRKSPTPRPKKDAAPNAKASKKK